MNTNEPTKSKSAEAATTGDEPVEVIVEDLFIEEYEVPLPPIEKAPRRVLGRLRSRSKSVVAVLLALGGLVAAKLLAGERRRRTPLFKRWLFQR
jgi:hypothetical protein